MSKNAKLLTFDNLMGNCSSVFYNGVHCAFIDNPMGGCLSEKPSDYRFEWRASFQMQIPFTGEQILTEYLARRKSEWAKETSKMDGGWTQWDSLNVESWEAVNRERLAKALKPFGLKITFEDLSDSQSSWFKIAKA